LNAIALVQPRRPGSRIGSHLALAADGITLQQALDRFQRGYAPVLTVATPRVANDTQSSFLKLR
jgi:hypothetical protein